MSNKLLENSGDGFRFTGLMHPLHNERVDQVLPEGLNILQALWIACPDPILLRHAHVFVGDVKIPKDMWESVRPKAGAQITVAVVPMGGGGGGKKNPLQMVLMLGFAAASFFGPGLILGAAANTAVFGGITAGQLLGAAISLVGTLVQAALAPPPPSQLKRPDQPADSPTYSLTGSANNARLYSPIPRVLGTHRQTPPLGAKSYSEIRGDEQYLRMMVVWGYGPLAISDLKIGETPLANFAEVEVEHRYGYDTDTPLTLYSNDVNEEGLSILLNEVDGWQVRTTQINTDEITIDVAFLSGLVQFTSTNAKVDTSVDITFEIRAVGTIPWTNSITKTFTENTTSQVRRDFRWVVANGQYEVRGRRATPDNTQSTRIFDRCTWSALRSITYQDPFNLPGVAKTALVIRATDQLNGVVSQLNAVCTSILPDWDAATSTWITRATGNPASLFRAVMTGSANKRAVGTNRIALSKIEAWHEFCDANGYAFNGVVDFSSTVGQTLDQIASTGRASKTMEAGQFSVVIDQPQTVPIQHFTPRNSWGFSGERTFLDFPHGWRIRFVNELQGYAQDEMIVYADGYSSANASNFETLELPGITHPDLIWKFGRYHYATAQLRPETFTFYADIENIVCTRGDLIGLNHDVIFAGLGSGRIRSIIKDVSNNITDLELDDEATMEIGKVYALAIRTVLAGTQIYEVITNAGDQTTLSLKTPVADTIGIAVDDIYGFGEKGAESMDVLVHKIEPGQDLTAKLTVIPAAPAVYQADQGPIPAFTSNISLPAGLAAPAIQSIRSDGSVLIEAVGGGWINRMVVAFQEPGRARDDVASLQMAYRQQGGGDDSWEILPAVPATQLEIAISGVESGKIYEIKSRYILDNAQVMGWSAVVLHTVLGKEAPPADVAWLTVQQNGPNVTLRWPLHPERDVDQHILAYGPVGSVVADATSLTTASVGTVITTATVLPGNWDFFIRAVDSTGNISATATVARLNVISEFDMIVEVSGGPVWPGLANPASGGFIRNPLTGVLNPASTAIANTVDPFASYVPSPVALSTYQENEIDIEFDDNVRVWGTVSNQLGVSETGVLSNSLQVDYRRVADAYDGFEDWTVREVKGRYFKIMHQQDNTGGSACLTAFTSIVDMLERSKSATVTIAAGGTAVLFDTAFHNVPFIEVSAASVAGAVRIATWENITKTGFTANIYDAAGNSVGGTLNYRATGV